MCAETFSKQNSRSFLALQHIFLLGGNIRESRKQLVITMEIGKMCCVLFSDKQGELGFQLNLRAIRFS